MWKLFVTFSITLTVFLGCLLGYAFVAPFLSLSQGDDVDFRMALAFGSVVIGLIFGLRYAAPEPEWFRRNRRE